MKGSPSLWWPTPTLAHRYFSDEELAESAAYSAPLARSALAAMVARLVLLALAAVVATRLTTSDPIAMGEGGWLPWSRPVLIGAVLAVVALRLPSVVVDAWFEYRHEPALLGYLPSPVGGFLLVVLATNTFIVFVAAAASALTYRLVANNSWWPVVLSAVVVVSVLAVGFGERWVRGLAPSVTGATQSAAVLALHNEFEELGHQFGLADVEYLCDGCWAKPVELGSETISTGPAGPGAHTTGIGPNRRVVVSAALLDEPALVRRFVVAHELAHLSGRHVLIQTLQRSLLAIGFIWLAAGALKTGQPWGWVGIDPIDPAGLAVVLALIVVYAIVVGPPAAWFARYHERKADLQAAAAVGVPELGQLRRLYLWPGIDLAPSRWARWFGHHPSPAERLEFLRRIRRD